MMMSESLCCDSDSGRSPVGRSNNDGGNDYVRPNPQTQRQLSHQYDSIWRDDQLRHEYLELHWHCDTQGFINNYRDMSAQCRHDMRPSA